MYCIDIFRLKAETSLNDAKKDVTRVSIRDKLLIKEVLFNLQRVLNLYGIDVVFPYVKP